MRYHAPTFASGHILARLNTPECGGNMRSAARSFALEYPDAALETLEIIGNWPSSEPELAALQAVWPVRQ